MVAQTCVSLFNARTLFNERIVCLFAMACGMLWLSVRQCDGRTDAKRESGASPELPRSGKQERRAQFFRNARKEKRTGLDGRDWEAVPGRKRASFKGFEACKSEDLPIQDSCPPGEPFAGRGLRAYPRSPLVFQVKGVSFGTTN